MLQTLLLASPHLFVSGAVLVIVAFASSTLWKALHGRITAPVLGKDDSYNFTKTMLKAWNTVSAKLLIHWFRETHAFC